MEINERLKEIFKKYANMRMALIILIIGIVFLCIPAGEKKNEKPEERVSLSYTEYVKDLEKRLSHILSTISGISDVSVMITVSDGGINTHEKDKSIKNEESKASLVLKSQGSGREEPILVKESLPTVLGAVITAKGAENKAKNAEIISAVKAVLNVSAHRISVLPK